MADEWQSTVYGKFPTDYALDRLADICDPENGIQTGPFGSQLHQEDYVEFGTPIITVEHLGENRIEHSDVPNISNEDRDRLSKFELLKGDIVFSRVGSVDRRALVREAEQGWLFSGRCLRVRPDNSKIDSGYLSYFFGHPLFKQYIRAIAVGATMPSLNTKLLRDVHIPYPPDIKDQRCIADILGSLDDKIELNRRMNATLEEMARAIFKSWFVNFDPVHAKARGEQPVGIDAETAALFPDSFEDSELGPIPTGWTVEPLKALCERITDGSHYSPKSVEVGYPMASVKDMHSWGFNLSTCRRILEADYETLVHNDCRPLAGDVLIAKDGSYLKHIFVVEKNLDLVILSSIAILRPNKRMNSHLLAFSLRSETTMNRMEQYVSGAVLQRIVLKDFRQFPLVLPSQGVQAAWAQIASPLVERCWQNVDETNTLAALRDALLPKLISGEIRVGNS